MSELRFHSGDPTRPAVIAEIGPAAGAFIAALLLAAGSVTAFGLMAAPDLIADFLHSAEQAAVRESARRGAEAIASVGRRHVRLTGRLGTDELFLARVAQAIDVPLPRGFPADPPAEPAATPEEMEVAVTSLARRVRSFEIFRRQLAALPRPLPGGAKEVEIPSRSPLEPSVAVVLVPYGPRTSPLTRRPEFFPGLELAAPGGTPVVAPAGGTVIFAGPPPRKSEADWRRLGTLLVIAHDTRTRTVYGHLERLLVKKGQRVVRGQTVARVGQSGFSPTPRLHYEVRRLSGESFLPVDPRLFILDVDWITAAELRGPPVPPADLDLPPAFH